MKLIFKFFGLFLLLSLCSTDLKFGDFKAVKDYILLEKIMTAII